MRVHGCFVFEWLAMRGQGLGRDFSGRCRNGGPAFDQEYLPKENPMSRYVDGFVLPIPKKNLARYRRVARIAAKVWRDHGALEYVECVADQLTSKHEGKTFTSLFPKLAKVKKGEVVVFSWITYKSKADQKRVMKKV